MIVRPAHSQLLVSNRRRYARVTKQRSELSREKFGNDALSSEFAVDNTAVGPSVDVRNSGESGGLDDSEPLTLPMESARVAASSRRW